MEVEEVEAAVEGVEHHTAGNICAICRILPLQCMCWAVMAGGLLVDPRLMRSINEIVHIAKPTGDLSMSTVKQVLALLCGIADGHIPHDARANSLVGVSMSV